MTLLPVGTKVKEKYTISKLRSNRTYTIVGIEDIGVDSPIAKCAMLVYKVEYPWGKRTVWTYLSPQVVALK